MVLEGFNVHRHVPISLPPSLPPSFPPSLPPSHPPARFYSSASSFHRLLRLLSNEVMVKARDIVGADVLASPEKVASGGALLVVRGCGWRQTQWLR